MVLFTMENGEAQMLQSSASKQVVSMVHLQSESDWYTKDTFVRLFVHIASSSYHWVFHLQISDFWREACTLGQLHHPNVVAFYGIVPDGPGGTLATVTEYMVNGSLKQVLHKKDRFLIL